MAKRGKKKGVPKATIKRGHRIAKAIIREGKASKVKEPYAVGMAVAMGTAKRRGKRKRKRR